MAHPGFCYKKKQFSFQQNFSSTELLLQDLPLPLELLFILAIFVFQKTCQSITHVGLKNIICTTFTFQGRHCRQPSSQARVTSHKLPASLKHLKDSRFWADFHLNFMEHFSGPPSPASSQNVWIKIELLLMGGRWTQHASLVGQSVCPCVWKALLCLLEYNGNPVHCNMMRKHPVSLPTPLVVSSSEL